VAQPADAGGLSSEVDSPREALLAVLVRHKVRFVLIGGAAIQSHGRRYDTQDIDVSPETHRPNLQRLCDALNELQCRLVTNPANPAEWVPLPSQYFTPKSLAGSTVWNVATRHGLLDISFAPSAFPDGYAELSKRAEKRRVAGTTLTVSVAALDDIHRSKRAANRPKDQAYFRSLPDEPG
jgi:hypothetical protein